MKVVVLSGGRSSEHEVSLESGKAVMAGLADAGHDPIAVLIERDGRFVRDGEPLALTPAGGLLGADAVFPALHGPFGEDGTIQGLLECLDVPYVGPGVLAAAVAMDKLVFKRLCAFHGLPQVEFCEVGEEGWREMATAMARPLWVKPSRLGSSVGISKVEGRGAELDDAVEAALRHDPRVIIEAHGGGREVECSVMGNDELEVSLPGQITISSDWYDYEAKYKPGGMDLVVPAPIGEEATARLTDLARRAFRAAGVSGLARCDFFVRDDGEVLVNEINTMPGFTSTSVFAKLFEASGKPYPEVCDRLVQLAVERHRAERAYAFSRAMGKLVLGVVAAVAVAVAIGAPSSGARGEPTTACPKDKLCVWEDANYGGDRMLISTRKLSNKLYDNGFNDTVSSLKLRKPGAAILYTDTDGGAPYRCFRFEDRKVPDLASPDWQFDNVASSSKIPKNENNAACSAP